MNISPQQTIYPVVHPLIPRLSRFNRDQILILNLTLNSQDVMRRLLLNKKPKITELILLYFTISYYYGAIVVTGVLDKRRLSKRAFIR